MPSPFPGMDPHLEDRRLWPSVHHRLISTISDMLTAQVAPRFYVTIEERVYITTALLDLGAMIADVYTRGTYGLRLDYTQPPPPPSLRKADAV